MRGHVLLLTHTIIRTNLGSLSTHLVGKIVLPSSILQFWDLGGQRDIRNIWVKYYDSCHAVAYVVDASDLERLAEGWEVFGACHLLSFEPPPVYSILTRNDYTNHRHGPEPPSNRRSSTTSPCEQAGSPRLANSGANSSQLRRMVAASESRACAQIGQAADR